MQHIKGQQTSVVHLIYQKQLIPHMNRFNTKYIKLTYSGNLNK